MFGIQKDGLDGAVSAVHSNTEAIIARLEAEAERLANMLEVREEQRQKLVEALPQLKSAYQTSVKLYANNESEIGKEEIQKLSKNLRIALAAFQAVNCSIQNIREALKDLHSQIDELTSQAMGELESR